MRKYTVQQFTDELTSIINATYDDIISVSGEVSNFSMSSAKHIYFTLKDATSALKVVYFRQSNSGVSAFIPKNGDKVEVLGTVSVYKNDGSYQLIAKKVTYQSLGDLYEQYILLKNKLEKAGLFDEAKKKPIKQLPKSVALITSKTGAGITDFITSANRNKADFELILYNVPVQGDEAYKEIVNAIKKADATGRHDVIVIMRGGGSYDELSLFNNEEIALAISDAKTAVISAIGHERDVTIADFVADKRASTPTSAGNILSEGYLIAYEKLATIDKRLLSLITDKLNNFNYTIDKLTMRLNLSSPKAKVKRIDDNLTLISNKLKSIVTNRFLQSSSKLSLLSQRLNIGVIERRIKDNRLLIDSYVRTMRNNVDTVYEQELKRLQLIDSRLELLNPYNVLMRGYTVVKIGDRFIKTIDDVNIDDTVDIRFKDGSVSGKVINKQTKLEE